MQSKLLLMMIFSSILIVTSIFSATTGKIAGVVKDAQTGEPLPGVNVVIVGTSMGAATDVDGHYFIINIPPGKYSVKVSMIGYQSVTKQNVEVFVNHTTPLNFDLSPEVISGEEVVVEAEREIVKMDMSSSTVSVTAEEVTEVPLVTDIKNFVNLQAGIDGWSIRGGHVYETAFMLDGLMLVDNRSNAPLATPNLSSIQAVDVIKGGFNAEYGNARSGVINIVTKEGTPDGYHGSVELRLDPPRLEHSGHNVFSHESWHVRPFVDPEVCYDGTSNWPQELQEKYKSFGGWNNDPDVKAGKLTAEERRQLFIWRHRLEGADELVPPGYDGPPRVGSYGDKIGMLVDLGLGGPIPILKNTTFFFSHKVEYDPFALPTNRDYLVNHNTQLNVAVRINPKLKIKLDGLYGELHTVASKRASNSQNAYLTSGHQIVEKGLLSYYPENLAPVDVFKSMFGVSFEHVLSPSTFYNIRFTYARVKNFNSGPRTIRDTTTVRYFGEIPVDEIPYGYYPYGQIVTSLDDMGWHGGMTRDYSWVKTYNIRGDLTSQVNRYHQIKVGFEYNVDDIHSDYGQTRAINPFVYKMNIQYDKSPIRAAAYIQDKIEFEGMIANVGLRADYFNSNTDWYTADRYSPYFNDVRQFTKKAPKEKAKDHLKLAPRFGISHPISEKTKLFFNYGWFYSLPQTPDLYEIYYIQHQNKIGRIGNPSADLPKTVAYELGFEQDVSNMFLLRVAGYYKDVSNETGQVKYTNYDGTVSYNTIENTHYRDIRGFEFEVRKRLGKWIKGWMNYEYRVQTSGYIGRKEYYENPLDQMRYGLQNPYQERPLPRPIFRANLQLMTPRNWGPKLGGIRVLSGWNLSFLYTWRAGQYITWDPLNQKLKDNLQWKPYTMLDGRLSRRFSINDFDFTFYVDAHNILDTKRLNLDLASMDSNDKRAYLESLHLPMYDDPLYKNAGYTPGNDRLGDVKSDDKPYINMPNIDTFWYTDPRTVTFGLKVDF